jgi:hypothetical protein
MRKLAGSVVPARSKLEHLPQIFQHSCSTSTPLSWVSSRSCSAGSVTKSQVCFMPLSEVTILTNRQ